MPAHITALAPFLPVERLSREVVARLRELCAAVGLMEVQFRRVARFPDVLWLDPEPASGLRVLTAAIAERWPETPPYGGMLDPIPHLTVAQGAGEDILSDIEADVLPKLPVEARLVEARIYVFDGAGWKPRARLPFENRLRER